MAAIANSTSLDSLSRLDSFPLAAGTRADELTSLRLAAYKTALLAPILICSCTGWVLGATVGDTVGTLIGSGISLALEIVVRKYVLNDPSLQEDGVLLQLTKDRIKSALIMTAGNIFCGFVFNTALTYLAPLISSNTFVQAVVTGFITAGAFVLGTTSARALYTITAISYFTVLQSRESIGKPQIIKAFNENAVSISLEDRNKELIFVDLMNDDYPYSYELVPSEEKEEDADLIIHQMQRQFTLDKDLKLSWANLKKDILFAAEVILPSEFTFNVVKPVAVVAAVVAGTVAGTLIEPSVEFLAHQLKKINPRYI